MKWIVSLAVIGTAAATAMVASTGCGGGGGGGGSSTGGGTGGGTGASYSYSGTVTDQSGDLVSGDIVSFDGNSSYEATTNSSGVFDIKNVPASLDTSSDYLAVTDASGSTVATYSLAGTSGSQAGIVITIGPPPPPSSLVVKAPGKKSGI